MRSSISRGQKVGWKTGRDEGCNIKSGDSTDSSDLYAKKKNMYTIQNNNKNNLSHMLNIKLLSFKAILNFQPFTKIFPIQK